LTEAGFSDIDFVGSTCRLTGCNRDEAMTFMTSLGLARGLMQYLDDDARANAIARLRQALDEHTTADGVLFRASSWLITARRR